MRKNGGPNLEAPPDPDEPELTPVQLTRFLFWFQKRLNRIMLVGGIVVVAIVSSTFTYGVVSTMQRGDIQDAAEAARAQGVGAAVGSCALNRVTLGLIGDLLTRDEQAGFRAPGMTDAEAAAHYATQRASVNQLIFDCKILAPADDRINIELEYPTTLPPSPAP